MVFCAALELRRASGVLPAEAGGNRPLLFVIASPSFLVIASPDLSGRGNLARAQDAVTPDKQLLDNRLSVTFRRLIR